jgi:C-terminal processing protease CtpA/Prc
LAALLSELWPMVTRPTAAASNRFEKALYEGLLRPVPGHAYLIPAKEARVQAQLQANRYIGIGIALGMDDKTQLPQIKMVQAGGPARLGGVRVGDLLEEIDHVRVVREAQIGEIVDRLRGPEGSELTIRVRQPNAKESRTLALVRLPVMFKSVKCSAENADEDQVVLLNANPAIAYLKIDSIMASTARELASWEPRLRKAGVKGLVIDLRGVGGHGGFDSYHSALLLADTLLDGKPMGNLLTRDGSRTFTADRDCLFRDMPLAVLTDANTNGPAEWVAAALQDSTPAKQARRRAIIVGDRTEGPADNFVRTAFSLPGGDESLILATAAWERPGAIHGREDDEPAQAKAKSEWRVAPDVTYDVAVASLQTMVTQMLAANPAAQNHSGKIARRNAAAEVPAKSAAAPVVYDAIQKGIDSQYKQAAVAAIRQQLELAAKSGQ